jgi:hypothetical protein
MEHLIPTLLGIAGALAPVAFGYLRQERPAMARQVARPARLAVIGSRVTLDDAVIRGGRFYL